MRPWITLLAGCWFAACVHAQTALTALPPNPATELVTHALGFLGTPYRLGGRSAKGFDCSGFVQSVYATTLGLELPRRARDQAQATERIEPKDLQPGDLVFFNTLRRAYSHVGIYVGDGRFIHSPRPGKRVQVETMSDRYWAQRFNGARRVLTAPVSG